MRNAFCNWQLIENYLLVYVRDANTPVHAKMASLAACEQKVTLGFPSRDTDAVQLLILGALGSVVDGVCSEVRGKLGKPVETRCFGLWCRNEFLQTNTVFAQMLLESQSLCANSKLILVLMAASVYLTLSVPEHLLSHLLRKLKMRS